MSGVLIKLTIIPFIDTAVAPYPSGPPFVVPFNPETFSISSEIHYAEQKVAGSTGTNAKFDKVAPRTFSFDIFLDATGSSGLKIPLHPLIKLFEASVGVLGDIHRPSFFMLSWGPRMYKAVIKKYTISYKLFSPEGMPLRAVISTDWEEMKPEGLLANILNFLSPDVTHRHTVIAGEHLSLITYRTYKTDSYYYEVARANGLDNLRELKPGQVVELYPLE